MASPTFYPQLCCIDDENFETFVEDSLSPLSILNASAIEFSITPEHTQKVKEELVITHKLINTQVSPVICATTCVQIQEEKSQPYLRLACPPLKRILTFKGSNRRRKKFNMPEDQFIMFFSLTSK
jgi:hypothetical protein